MVGQAPDFSSDRAAQLTCKRFVRSIPILAFGMPIVDFVTGDGLVGVLGFSQQIKLHRRTVNQTLSRFPHLAIPLVPLLQVRHLHGDLGEAVGMWIQQLHTSALCGTPKRKGVVGEGPAVYSIYAAIVPGAP